MKEKTDIANATDATIEAEIKNLAAEEAQALGQDTPEPQAAPEENALALADENKPTETTGNAAGFFEDVATQRRWFNVKTKEEALTVVRAMDDTDFQLGDCLGQVIEVVHIVAHETTFENEKKELVDAIRTVLIDTNGKSYGSVAGGVRDSVASLFSMVGLPPYEPPIKLCAVNKKTRAGFKTLKLVPVV